MVKWFTNSVPVAAPPLIIEVEKPRPLADLKKMPDADAAVTSLAGHPGWDYLLAKLKTQRSYLEATLRSSPMDNLVEVARLQAGIYWAGWLETQLSQSAARVARAVAPSPEEDDIFKQIMGAMRPVGQV